MCVAYRIVLRTSIENLIVIHDASKHVPTGISTPHCYYMVSELSFYWISQNKSSNFVYDLSRDSGFKVAPQQRTIYRDQVAEVSEKVLESKL